MDEAGERRSSRRLAASRTKNETALEKIRKLKEKKNKYDLIEDAPVYDIVDEAQYSRMVIDRQKDDWIVEDAVGGYCEDGREIFDDDVDSESDGEYGDGDPKRPKKKKQRIRRRDPVNQEEDEEEADNDDSRPKSKSIIDMFKGIQAKGPRKKKEVELKDEDLLTNILENDFGSCEMPTPKPPCPSSSSRVLLKKKQPSKPVPAPRKTLEQVKRGVEEALDISSLDDVVEPPKKKASTLDRSDCLIPDLPTSHVFEVDSSIVTKGESKLEDFESEFQSFSEDFNNKERSDSEPVVLPSNAEMEFDYFTDDSEKKYLKFYWIDACEIPSLPGTVFIFGKVFTKSSNCYVNTCVTVSNIEKQLFFLYKNQDSGSSRDGKSDDSLFEEVKELAKKLKVKNFKSKCVHKNYAFDRPGIPNEAKYLEVHFPARTSFPIENQMGKNYSFVFGTNQSSLERLILDRKMTGPGWMRLTNASPTCSAPISWCKAEFSLNSMKELSVDVENKDPVPPVTILSIGVKTLVNRSSLTSEIIAISGFVECKFSLENGTSSNKKIFSNHFCLVTKPSQTFQKIFPLDLIPSKIGEQYKQTKLEIANSERELLNLFMAKFFRIDPDIIVGHDIMDFDLDVLLQRLAHHKVGSWSKLGRLRKSGQPPVRKWEKNSVTCGRAVVDIKISARELIKAKSYDMSELAQQMLNETRRDLDQDVILSAYDRLQDFFRLVGWIMRDNQLTYRMMLELNVLPLALQITKIAGNLFSRTLLGGRSERNEFLLLHAFHEANYICPDKGIQQQKNNKFKSDSQKDTNEFADEKSAAGKKKAAYAGGLVLDPKVGYYTDYVLILDFNSLYPTIVREFNICFTTINLRALSCEQNSESGDDCLPPLPASGVEQGILPIQITRLVESRREVKKRLQDRSLTKDLKAQYNIKQMALKLTANSMYGCLGFGNSRFYAKPLAALITSKGREILMKTKNLVEEMGFEVIYGDTDSIMINTRSPELTEAVKISNKVQSSVNGMHKYLEIECDGILKCMLLLKKKKYAALTVKLGSDNSVSYEKEMKGLDIVRRDWSVIAKTAGEAVVNEILSIDKTIETVVENIHQYLRSTAESIRSIDCKSKDFIQQFIISKQLTKNPEEYPDKKNLSHVSVALAFNSKTDKKLRAGDVVSFIVCKRKNDDDFNKLPATQRAFHPSDVMSNDDLQVDITYYLEQQIHPVVSRLIEPLEGIDAHSVAEFLGLDDSFCPRRLVNASDEIVAAGKNKFDICNSLLLKCPAVSCGKDIEIRDPSLSSSSSLEKKVWSLSKCPHCYLDFEEEKNGKRIEKMLKLRVKSLMDQFYSLSFTCEDPMCGIKMTFSPAAQVKRKGVECPECRGLMIQDFPPPRLHLQLTFFEHIFDFQSSARNSSEESSTSINYMKYSLRDNLLEYVRYIRRAMSYSEIDLEVCFSDQIFSDMKSAKGSNGKTEQNTDHNSPDGGSTNHNDSKGGI